MLSLVNKFRLYAYLWWLTSKHKFTIRYILEKFWGWLRPYFTPRMIPIVLSIWVFTNGVWYVMAFAPIGLPLAVRTFAQSYIAFLYTPLGFEKPVILFVARIIYKIIYRNTFIPVYKVKLIKKLDYGSMGLITFSSYPTN